MVVGVMPIESKTTNCPVCGNGKAPEADYCFACEKYKQNQQQQERERKRREHFGS
jgi:hypothetical protein